MSTEKTKKSSFIQGAITAEFIGASIAKHQSKTTIGAHNVFLGQVRADDIEGKKVVSETENYANPLTEIIEKASEKDKVVLWQNISALIIKLNKLEVISVQRTCFNCKHYANKNKIHICNLLNQKLDIKDIRIDCREFEYS